MAIFDFKGGDYKSGEYTALPKGRYKVKISNTDMFANKLGTGDVLKITYDVVDGFYVGRKLFGNLNIKHINPDVENRAHNNLRGILKAVSLDAISNTDQLLNKELVVNIGTKEYEGKPTNTIYSYESIADEYPGIPSNQQLKDNQARADAEDAKNRSEYPF